MKKFLLILTALSALCVGRANAQRCLPKMQGIELKVNMADGFYTTDIQNKAGYSFGIALSSYAKGCNKWVYGVDYLQTLSPYKDIRIPISQFTAEGGFYYNFLSDKRKIVFCYIGSSVLAGYETVNWGEKLLFDGSCIRNKDAFVYGGALTLDCEVYLADRIALLANVRERCLFGGKTQKFHIEYGLGVKFIIN